MAWFVKAFGPWYPVVYPHRDETEARDLVGTISAVVPLAGARVLDVGCGAGRHLPAIAEAGAEPFGLDLSEALLAEARRVRGAVKGRWGLVRGDMRRLPVASKAVDGVTSLFTTFGYFDAAGDRAALGEAARVLRPGGFHILDFLNREAVVAHPKAETERCSGNWRIREWRRIEDGRRVIKRVEVTPTGGGEAVVDYEERVTLYGLEELRGLLRGAGLAVQDVRGDYRGAPFDAASSPRLVLLSRKEPR